MGGSVAIAASGLLGRIAVDMATGHVAQIPTIGSAMASHVNSDLGSVNRYVAAVIARFPFYPNGDAERCEEVAEELRDLTSGIDKTALVHNGRRFTTLVISPRSAAARLPRSRLTSAQMPSVGLRSGV
ncbi:hypothetical protein ACFV2X_47600 [Streptomyces sp. NPDC059679]|uniref:hypothetical protein n=1 Tax=Streptomyces sp. NPDC059679 TaxID=3346903 RepID=UPI0036B8ED27